MTTDRGAIQEEEYNFPYHYIPSLENGIPEISRTLAWGWDFLTYMDYVMNSIQNLSPSSLLDIGCGDGYMINQLHAKNINCSLRGIDISDRAIAFANAFCPSKDQLFSVQDIFRYTKKHDIVTAIEVIEHVPDAILPDFLQRIFDIANKYVIISVPTTVLPKYAKHYRHYDEEMLKEQTIESFEGWTLLSHVRLYRDNSRLKLIRRLMCNKYFEIRHRKINQYLWNWHVKNTYFASAEDGYHLVAIYKKD